MWLPASKLVRAASPVAAAGKVGGTLAAAVSALTSGTTTAATLIELGSPLPKRPLPALPQHHSWLPALRPQAAALVPDA